MQGICTAVLEVLLGWDLNAWISILFARQISGENAGKAAAVGDGFDFGALELYSCVTLAADDLVLLGEEALAHQGAGTFPTLKAVTVPLPILKWDKLGSTKG